MDKYKLSLDEPGVFKNVKVGDKIFWIPTHIGGSFAVCDHEKAYLKLGYVIYTGVSIEHYSCINVILPAIGNIVPQKSTTILRYRFYLPMIDYSLIEIL